MYHNFACTGLILRGTGKIPVQENLSNKQNEITVEVRIRVR